MCGDDRLRVLVAFLDDRPDFLVDLAGHVLAVFGDVPEIVAKEYVLFLLLVIDRAYSVLSYRSLYVV